MNHHPGSGLPIVLPKLRGFRLLGILNLLEHFGIVQPVKQDPLRLFILPDTREEVDCSQMVRRRFLYPIEVFLLFGEELFVCDSLTGEENDNVVV